MRHNPPPGTLIKMSFDVGTQVLYGIFVTEKSFLVGVRKLVKREHIKWLLSRVFVERLPQEVLDAIEQFIYELEKPAIEAAYLPNLGPCFDNRTKFSLRYDRPLSTVGEEDDDVSPAEHAAKQKLVSGGRRLRTGRKLC